MTTYGITPEGFNRKTLEVILDEMRSDAQSTIDPQIDLDSDGLLGQMYGVVARQLAELWEGLETAYHAFDRDATEGFLLTALCKLTGTERRDADYTVVKLECDLDAGTTLVTDVSFAATDLDPTKLWTPRENYTALVDGAQDVWFRAEVKGPIEALAGSITTISSGDTGWNSVSQAADGLIGRVSDNDPTLRERSEEQLFASGSSTAQAIKSDVLELEGMGSVDVFENVLDIVDSNGLPPHSFEVLIYEDDPIDDDLIAQTIWAAGAAGVRTVGSESGTATDGDGNDMTINFTRISSVEMSVEVTISTTVGYIGDTALKAAIAKECNEEFEAGDAAQIFFVGGVAYQGGVKKVSLVRLSRLGSSLGTSDVAMTPRERAHFDTANITVITV
jgi:uncharacterized phage protein gp47/JayE